MSESRQRSERRFESRNALWTKKHRPRQFLNTPRGNALTTDYITYLADFLAGKLDDKPHELPGFLQQPIRQLDDPLFLALATLAVLLDAIFRGWDGDDESAAAKLKLRVGDDVYQRLRKKGLTSRWGEAERLKAGDWLLAQAHGLDIFAYEEDGTTCISDKWRPDIAQIRERLIALKPDYAPLLKQPPPWTGSEKTYDGDFRVKFVRDWRPETQKAIDAAFLNPAAFEHARGVNALASVPLKIDPTMVALVERFAVELMGNKGVKRRADETKVRADVADAKWCDEHGPTIWNDYSCDRRGRIYALAHLNFAREDHVRSLFKFANGMKIEGDDPTYWLEIHCANCEGSTDKKSRDERRKWVSEHSQDIRAIARDPIGTFDDRVLGGRGWQKADSPFAFVAACRELAAAWNDPENFETHLPIGFDGSANGVQHLAMLAGDPVAAALVNLLSDANDDPSDAYAALIARARELIENDPCDHAHFWREQFNKVLSAKQTRKLLKTPIVAFGYSGEPAAAAKKIADVYYKELGQKAKAAKGGFLYLAKRVFRAWADELAAPKGIMDYICKIATHCTEEKRFMEWTTPCGLPVSNRYQKPNLVRKACLRGSVRVAQHKIAEGVTDEINEDKVRYASAPNFVHSLDAAHLIKVVNAAADEGITDLLTVHDCFYCVAPQATRLHKIILEQLDSLYRDNDPLTELRSRNVSDADILPVPPKGMLITPGQRLGRRHGSLPLDTLIVTTTRNGDGYSTRISFSPERVRDADDAFG